MLKHLMKSLNITNTLAKTSAIQIYHLSYRHDIVEPEEKNLTDYFKQPGGKNSGCCDGMHPPTNHPMDDLVGGEVEAAINEHKYLKHDLNEQDLIKTCQNGNENLPDLLIAVV